MNGRSYLVVSSLSVCLALLTASCAGPAPTTTRIVAREGGSVVAASYQIVIPAMSLPADADVTLETAPASGYLPLPNGLAEVILLRPEGTILGTPSTVTIRADFVDAAPGDTVSVHQLEMVDGTRWVPLASERGASGDVTVGVTRFAPLGVAVVPAPTGSGIRGIIRWNDGTPVASAPIQLFQGTTMLTMTTSDATGAYSFGDLPTGSYRVVVMYECSIDQATSVTAGALTTLDLVLCGV